MMMPESSMNREDGMISERLSDTEWSRLILGPSTEPTTAQAKHQEDEVIEGITAHEFADEAASHPERYRALRESIMRVTDHYGLVPRRILDAGCGSGMLIPELSHAFPRAKVIGIDGSTTMVEAAVRRLSEDQTSPSTRVLKGDIRDALSLAEGPCDLVVSRNTLHRVKDLTHVLARLVECVSQGGIFFNQSFLRLDPENSDCLNEFLTQYRLRRAHPAIQESWLLAMLTAPTREQYAQAVERVRCEFGAQDFVALPSQTSTSITLVIVR